MPTRVSWAPDFVADHPAIDAQHRALIEHCNLLADLCEADGDEAHQRFDAAFAEFKALVHQHFDTEAPALAQAGHEDFDAEEVAAELEDFDFMAGEIGNTLHFDRYELQRFVAVWCLGHVSDSAARLKP